MERQNDDKILKSLVNVCQGASKNTPRQGMKKNEDKYKEEKQSEQSQQSVNKVSEEAVPKSVCREKKMWEQRQREEQQQQTGHYWRKSNRHQRRGSHGNVGNVGNNVRNETVTRLSCYEGGYDKRCENNDIINRNANIFDIHYWPTLEESMKKKNPSFPTENDDGETNPELNITTTKVKNDKEKDKKCEKDNHCQTHNEDNGDKDRNKGKQKWIPLNINVIIHDRGTARSRYNQRERNDELKENEFCYEKINNRASNYHERGRNRKNLGGMKRNDGRSDVEENSNIKHVVDKINDCEEVVPRSDQSNKKMPKQQQRQQHQQQRQERHYRRKGNRHQPRGGHSVGNVTVAGLSSLGENTRRRYQEYPVNNVSGNATEDADNLNIDECETLENPTENNSQSCYSVRDGIVASLSSHESRYEGHPENNDVASRNASEVADLLNISYRPILDNHMERQNLSFPDSANHFMQVTFFLLNFLFEI